MENTSVPRTFVRKKGETILFPKTTHHYLLDLGLVKAEDGVSISASDDQPLTLDWYVLNEKALEEAWAVLSRDQMEVTEVKDTGLLGTVNCSRNGLMAFSVPAESGWNVYVDGKLKEKETFLGSLLAIQIEEGYHQIEIKYSTPYFAEGLTISLLCIAILITAYIIDRRKRKRFFGLHSRTDKGGD